MSRESLSMVCPKCGSLVCCKIPLDSDLVPIFGVLINNDGSYSIDIQNIDFDRTGHVEVFCTNNKCEYAFGFGEINIENKFIQWEEEEMEEKHPKTESLSDFREQHPIFEKLPRFGRVLYYLSWGEKHPKIESLSDFMGKNILK